MTYSIETKTCGRCGGVIGTFRSYSVYGGKCFECTDTGKVLTPAGKKVAVAYAAAQRRTFDEIEVGTRVWTEALSAGSFNAPAVAWTVDSIDRDGERVKLSGTDSKGERHGHDGTAASMIRLVLTREEKQTILASFAPRAGLLLDGEPTKVTKSRKTDAEKAATKLAARERNAAKREAERHADPASEKQIALIMSYGFEPFRPVSKFEASQVIDRIFSR